jgi:hypothetical protein
MKSLIVTALALALPIRELTHLVRVDPAGLRAEPFEYV